MESPRNKYFTKYYFQSLEVETSDEQKRFVEMTISIEA
jgi:hypothetical protein